MSRIVYVQTIRTALNPHWRANLAPELRFETKYTTQIDRFSADHGYSFEDLGVKVRITGESRAILVPWTAISYAEELPEPEPEPQPETTLEVAATPRAKRGGSR